MATANEPKRRPSTVVHIGHVYAQGYLHKQGAGMVSITRRRFFVLVGEVLVYYGTEEQFNERKSQYGAVPLGEASECTQEKNVLYLNTNYRRYVFTAHDNVEAGQWLGQLRDGIARAKRIAKERPKNKAKLAAATVLGDVRVDRLKRELESTRQDLTAMTGQKEELSVQLERTTQSLTETRNTLSAAKEAAASTESKLATTETALTSASREIEQLSAAWDESKAKATSLEHTLKQHDRTNMLKIAVAKTITDTHDHKSKDVIEKLHGEVNKLMEELKSANISIGQLTAESQSKQEKLDNMAKAYGDVKSDLKTSNATVQNLTRSLNDTKVSLNDTIQAKCVADEKLAVTLRDLNDAQCTIESKTNELSNTVEKLEETSANLGAAEAENARLCAELSKCQRQLENVNNRVMSSYEQLKSLKEVFNSSTESTLATLLPQIIIDDEADGEK